MKLYKTIKILTVGVFGMFAASCENQNAEFPDYEGGTTVYFANQFPVRTIILGEDKFDNTLDNEHRFQIYATMGGVYKNNKKITIDITVDNDLCDNLFFEDGSQVVAMPSNYYTLAGDQIILDKSHQGAVGVQLTDAFFADPKALTKTYAIPVLMTNVKNADRILTGQRMVEGAPRQYTYGWSVAPQDFVLYCLKFINPWEAVYLRRGVDQITENGVTTTNVRHAKYVENDEICYMTTEGLKLTNYPVSTSITTIGSDGEPTLTTLTCELMLTFNDNNECSITSGTSGYTASGSGKFVEKGEKNSWGNKDRSVMYLEYNIDFGVRQYATRDTLVVQDRGIEPEFFTPSYKVN